MQSRLWPLALLSFLFTIGICASPPNCSIVNGKVPLGINLGLTSITAACLNTSQMPVPVARLELDGRYRAFVQDTFNYHGFNVLRQGKYYVPDGDQLILAPEIELDEVGIMEIFESALSNITQAAADIVDGPVNIGVVTIPEPSNWTVSKPVYNAVEAVDDDVQGDWVMRSLCNMVAYDYDGSYEYCTREPDDIRDQRTKQYIVIVNVELDLVEMFVVKISTYYPLCIGETLLKGIQFPNNNNVTWADRDRISEALTTLLTDHLASWERNGKVYDPMTDLEAFVLTGEPTLNAVSALADLLNATLPDVRTKIQTARPEYRAALGATCDQYLMRLYPSPGIFNRVWRKDRAANVQPLNNLTAGMSVEEVQHWVDLAAEWDNERF